MPPAIKLEQAKALSLYMLKAVMSGRGDEVIELAKTNWLKGKWFKRQDSETPRMPPGFNGLVIGSPFFD
ncbi:MAG: hypothetical protein ACN6P5_04715 [Pseudomonas protegens]|uniref:hypothetical protein n=1 Tax=Pseudomonas protegens TaxID=380021 RepID=UPI00383B0AF4